MPKPEVARVTQQQLDKAQRASAELSKAYSVAFSGPPGQVVLEDLAAFCRANTTCFDADPRLHAVLEGRREVWLRIQNSLNLTPEQLFALRAPPQIIIVKEQSSA